MPGAPHEFQAVLQGSTALTRKNNILSCHARVALSAVGSIRSRTLFAESPVEKGHEGTQKIGQYRLLAGGQEDLQIGRAHV